MKNLFGCMLLLILTILCCSVAGAEEWPARVRDDSNNLRTQGGKEYKQAEVIGVLNENDRVMVYEEKDGWAFVGTGAGQNGYVHSACLERMDLPLATTPMPAELRTRLDRFLKNLGRAAKTANWDVFGPIIPPEGVLIQGEPFRDAAFAPHRQASGIVPVWYATDATLTHGTAWELLVVGAEPVDVTLAFGEEPGMWHVLKPGESDQYAMPAVGVDPVIPMHEQALRLADEAVLVQGWMREIPDHPLGDDWRSNFETTPFTIVYEVGNGVYRMEQHDHLGFVVTVREVDGMLRLHGVFCQPF